MHVLKSGAEITQFTVITNKLEYQFCDWLVQFGLSVRRSWTLAKRKYAEFDSFSSIKAKTQSRHIKFMVFHFGNKYVKKF